jgi:gamma-glutamyltranspeptidase/glutathione hydrolase
MLACAACAACAACGSPPRTISSASPAALDPIVQGRSVVARHAMVVSNSSIASEAGVEILRRGGNAVDAAVTVGFALAVTHPEAGNIGGGGYMVIRLADGRRAAFDYREVAPLAATRDMFVASNGTTTNESIAGYKAAGVPGAVAGMAAAEAEFGALRLRDVLAPAIRLAREGFVVDSAFARSLARAAPLVGQFAGSERFLPNGRPPQAGTRFMQPELARTLELIAASGPNAFYRGAIADSILAEERRGGGLITAEDLAGYRVVRRTPIVSTYRGDTVITMPPSSGGGVAIAEALNLLSTYDSLPPFSSAAHARLLSDVFQRVFIDRNERVGDPDFVHMPLALLDTGYARRVRQTISPAHAIPTAALVGALGGLAEGTQTTHYSVVDAAGNAVATTTTLNDLYGSGVYVRGAGFFLNDEMDDFTVRPGVPNMFGLVQGPQNAIEPGKRMLSSMSPTIVLDHAGDLLAIVGGRGGSRIITSVAQVIINMVDYHMGLDDAMGAPRVHHQALPDTLRYEPGALSAAAVDSLRLMGYATAVGGASGTCTAIVRVIGPAYEGVVDPRASGGAAGY